MIGAKHLRFLYIIVNNHWKDEQANRILYYTLKLSIVILYSTIQLYYIFTEFHMLVLPM